MSSSGNNGKQNGSSKPVDEKQQQQQQQLSGPPPYVSQPTPVYQVNVPNTIQSQPPQSGTYVFVPHAVQQGSNERAPLLGSQPIAVVPPGAAITITHGPNNSITLLPVAQHFKRRKNHMCFWIIFLIVIFFVWKSNHFVYYDDEHYVYPPDSSLQPSMEFERPVRCYPVEATNAVYPWDKPATVDPSLTSLTVNVTGIARGTLSAIVDESLAPNSPIEIDAHIHRTSDKPVFEIKKVTDAFANGLYVGIETPNYRHPNSQTCMVVALRLRFPPGYTSRDFQVTLEADNMAIQADLALSRFLSFKARTHSGSIRVNQVQVGANGILLSTGSGSIRAEEITALDAGKVDASTYSGSIRLEKVTTKSGGTVAAKTGSGSIRVKHVSTNPEADIILETTSGSIRVSKFAAKEVRLKTGSGSIRVEDATIHGNSTAQATSGSVSISEVSLKAHNSYHIYKSFSGSMRLDRVSLEESDAIHIDAATTSGSVRSQLSDFHGEFSIQTTVGSVSVEGGPGLHQEYKTKKSISGWVDASQGRGRVGVHDLKLSSKSGSVQAEFIDRREDDDHDDDEDDD